MKTIKQLLITVVVLLCSATASAHDFEVDGIYYNIISANDLTVAVTYKGNSYDEISNEYSGEVIIPETVVYKSKVLKVTRIDSYAFYDCSIESISIPGSVISISNYAFNECNSLTNLRLEDGTESLSLGYNYNDGYHVGEGLFGDCPLKTLYLGRNLSFKNDGHSGYSPFYKSLLTSVTIGNSVTCTAKSTFYECSKLKEVHTSDLAAWCGIDFASANANPLCYAKNLYLNDELVTALVIPDNVTNIRDYAFYGCSGLTRITIPNSVTSIGDYAFKDCTGLTSIKIPNSVTSIGEGAFYGCSGITSITIPNNVTSIGEEAFSECSNLIRVKLDCPEITNWFHNRDGWSDNGTSIKSFVFGNNVKKLKLDFSSFKALINIHLLGETPPTVSSDNFTQSQYTDIILYVPVGYLETYQNADTWKNFWDIREEGTTETPEEDVKKCAIPVITYNDNGLDITTETDGAEIHTNITCNDANSYNSSRIDLTETYSITTYATKSGYLNSEIVTATLCWIAVNGSSEENGIIEVEAMPVLITCNNGTINISGGKDGAEVVVYTTSGVAVGNATITNGNASISTELAMGEIVVVNIAGKGIKIVMQ